MQYKISHSDLTLILALVRGGSLARAANLLKVDVSTVFRAIRRLETELGSTLFAKSRRGYLPTSVAQALAERAEQAELALETAQRVLEQGEQVISGTVRLTCTDAVLSSLLLPALAEVMPRYPALSLELVTSSSFANLSRRDADMALRLTNTPPEHLAGRCLGSTGYRVYGRSEYRAAFASQPGSVPWIGPDEAMPDHPTVLWRREQHPEVSSRYKCSDMSAVAQLVSAGLGVAALSDFMARDLPDVESLSDALPDCSTQLWLLTRPDCRSLRTVRTLFDELGPLISNRLATPPSSAH